MGERPDTCVYCGYKCTEGVHCCSVDSNPHCGACCDQMMNEGQRGK